MLQEKLNLLQLTMEAKRNDSSWRSSKMIVELIQPIAIENGMRLRFVKVVEQLVLGLFQNSIKEFSFRLKKR
jgi:translation elongation factor EF-Tu-like GTPase